MNSFILNITASSGEFYQGSCESMVLPVKDGVYGVQAGHSPVLVDSAENPEDIDKNRAEAARIRAEERLQHKQSMHEYYQTKIALDRAMQRLQTAAKYKR